MPLNKLDILLWIDAIALIFSMVKVISENNKDFIPVGIIMFLNILLISYVLFNMTV